VTNQQLLRTIGVRVREARLKANMTQECLAELVGVHWKTVGHIERGSYPVALTTFVRLSQFLEISPNRLLDGLGDPDLRRTAQIKKAMARKRAPAKREVI
jgi:DNA-binding XRE family transcriptional regulator